MSTFKTHITIIKSFENQRFLAVAFTFLPQKSQSGSHRKARRTKKLAQRGNISAKEEGNQLLKSISHPKQLVEYFARQKAKNNVGLFKFSLQNYCETKF